MATKNHNRQEIIFRDMEKAMNDPAAQGNLEELCYSGEYQGSVFDYIYERLEYMKAEEEFASAEFSDLEDSLFNIKSEVEQRLVKGVFGLVKDTEFCDGYTFSNCVYRVQSFRFDVGHSFFLDASCYEESFTKYVGFVGGAINVFERIAPHMEEGMQILVNWGIPNLLEEPRIVSRISDYHLYDEEVRIAVKGRFDFIYFNLIPPRDERHRQLVRCRRGHTLVIFPDATRDEALEWMTNRWEDFYNLEKRNKSNRGCSLHFWPGNGEEVVIDDPSSPSDPRFGHKITIYRSSPGSTPR